MEDKGVSRKTMKRQTVSAYRVLGFHRSVVCLTALVYLGLVVLAASCASMPVAQSETHHHSHESTHSPLCAWSCHMISQDKMVGSVFEAVVRFVVTSLATPSFPAYSASPHPAHASRAPPVSTFGSFRGTAFFDCVCG